MAKHDSSEKAPGNAESPSVVEVTATVEEEYVPDGGKEAWLVVLGSTMGLFASLIQRRERENEAVLVNEACNCCQNPA